MSKKIFANNDETKFALIDDDIAEIIKEMKLKFCIQPKGYFLSTTKIQLPCMEKKKCLQLHRFVYIIKTGEKPTSEVDHINRDKSNNMFKNLRLATRQQQCQHQGKKKSNTSCYIGVCYYHQVDKRGNGYYYWKAQIQRPDRKREQKYFPYTENGKQHAAMWYDQKAIEYFGNFCGELNFPTE